MEHTMTNQQKKALDAYKHHFEYSQGDDFAFDYDLAYDEDHAKSIVQRIFDEHSLNNPDVAKEIDIENCIREDRFSFSTYRDGDKLIPCYSDSLSNLKAEIDDRINEANPFQRAVLEDLTSRIEDHHLTAWIVEKGYLANLLSK
jgi:hypothetical protein